MDRSESYQINSYDINDTYGKRSAPHGSFGTSFGRAVWKNSAERNGRNGGRAGEVPEEFSREKCLNLLEIFSFHRVSTFFFNYQVLTKGWKHCSILQREHVNFARWQNAKSHNTTQGILPHSGRSWHHDGSKIHPVNLWSKKKNDRDSSVAVAITPTWAVGDEFANWMTGDALDDMVLTILAWWDSSGMVPLANQSFATGVFTAPFMVVRDTFWL